MSSWPAGQHSERLFQTKKKKKDLVAHTCSLIMKEQPQLHEPCWKIREEERRGERKGKWNVKEVSSGIRIYIEELNGHYRMKIHFYLQEHSMMTTQWARKFQLCFGNIVLLRKHTHIKSILNRLHEDPCFSFTINNEQDLNSFSSFGGKKFIMERERYKNYMHGNCSMNN